MPATRVSIHLAILSDAPTLALLGETTFHETFAHQNTESDMKKYVFENFSKEQVIKELEDANNKFFLARWHEQPIGYMKLRLGEHPDQPKNTKSVELERIYVLKDFLNNKAGAALLGHAINLSRNMGYQTLWLGVWEHNERAINFYVRWGFTTYGSHIFVLGTDPQIDILMKKDLNGD